VYDPEVAVFEEHVALKALGDDSLGSVSDFASQKYDMVHIADFLKRTMGIKYTGCDKNAAIVPFIPLAEATFLGRTFRVLHDGKMAGPLRETAIHNLVAYTVDVPGMTPAQVDEIRVDQALREAALHGHNFYTSVRNGVAKFYQQRYKDAPKTPDFKTTLSKVLANWYKNDFDGIAEPQFSKAANSC